ncbi:hypothetical protein KAX17_07125 [Candidatus Bipolaricaulota bacterium]|nr:hypothetical protein [Candidatus Bipolaricaulota bacterium]
MGEEVLHHHRPEWLEGLELDVYVPSRKLAFEYQGQQHFHPLQMWGGKAALEKTKERDARKRTLCTKVGVKLVQIDYTEPLTKQHIRSQLKVIGETF